MLRGVQFSSKRKDKSSSHRSHRDEEKHDKRKKQKRERQMKDEEDLDEEDKDKGSKEGEEHSKDSSFHPEPQQRHASPEHKRPKTTEERQSWMLMPFKGLQKRMMKPTGTPQSTLPSPSTSTTTSSTATATVQAAVSPTSSSSDSKVTDGTESKGRSVLDVVKPEVKEDQVSANAELARAWRGQLLDGKDSSHPHSTRDGEKIIIPKKIVDSSGRLVDVRKCDGKGRSVLDVVKPEVKEDQVSANAELARAWRGQLLDGKDSSHPHSTRDGEKIIIPKKIVDSSGRLVDVRKCDDSDRRIREHLRFEDRPDRCRHCVGSDTSRHNVIISASDKVILKVPDRGAMVPYHCILCPIDHVSTTTELDEDVLLDIRNFKKCLIAMFSKMECDVIFLETAKNLKKSHHIVIECIPISFELMQEAPAYFKKSLMESEKEWSQNIKIVPTKSKERPLSGYIPKFFPYFHVEFGGLQEGYAHPIEDEEMFPWTFGKEILGSMMDVHQSIFVRPKKDSRVEVDRRVREFKEAWAPFDWTRA
eukprot:TRINITY_DN3632_c0_g1_i1.p1 TRINITY_DN3632_c0_g1~~TRINITY_DN3632_c0_g1_i1.p1  ORF type:complete len:532 (-),score=178.85 TRINITY_DN3632_c0_g1_i1:200-1795(-)